MIMTFLMIYKPDINHLIDHRNQEFIHMTVFWEVQIFVLNKKVLYLSFNSSSPSPTFRNQPEERQSQVK